MEVRRLPESELTHHGIKGQKWGVQNGPPYPLDRKKEFNLAKKKAKKLFNNTGKFYEKSKATQSVVNSKDMQDQVKKVHQSIENQLIKQIKKDMDDDEYANMIMRNDDMLWDYMVEDLHVVGDWTGAFEKYAKQNPEYKKALTDYKREQKIYKEKTKNYVNKIVGEYGDQPVSSDYKYKDFVEEVIDDVTDTYDRTDWHPALKTIK